jgi:agmatine/peptidylarginine deiminase
MQMKQIILPAEWQPQSAVQLTWPHERTDWAPVLGEVVPCFAAIADEVAKREKLLIVCTDKNDVRRHLNPANLNRVIFREMDTNDTWARDHGGISVWINGLPVVYDFVFNGWGMKYAAGYDNLITRRLFDTHTFAPQVELRSQHPFVLEGGSIDSNGRGVLLTTSACLGSPNRNDSLSPAQIDDYLKRTFGLRRILRLEDGYLEGDDTDAHVDTLARFCSDDAIVYVQCNAPTDSHFHALRRMEDNLKAFRQENGQPYRLLPLPMAPKVTEKNRRLPATYANFLVVNGAVLMPCYDAPEDRQAAAGLQTAFPGREIIGINCLPLIRQHGSLHCVAMQYPEDFI